MTTEAYLVISRYGSLRVVKNRPALNNDEIAVQLNLDIPKVFFDRMIPQVTITIPEDAMINLDAATVVKQISPEVAESLKLDVKSVEDGLLTLVKEQNGQSE